MGLDFEDGCFVKRRLKMRGDKRKYFKRKGIVLIYLRGVVGYGLFFNKYCFYCCFSL